MCVCVYLVVRPDMSGEDCQVVKAQRHIIVHVLVQPLIGGARVAMETNKHTRGALRLTFGAVWDKDHLTHTHKFRVTMAQAFPCTEPD